MSKGLEALQFMRERDMFLPSCASTIEKELKALEVIKSFPYLVKIILEMVSTYGKDNVDNYELLKEVLL